MKHYFNNEGNALVVDLRMEVGSTKHIYEDVIERYTVLTQETYEKDLYHIYISQDPNFKKADEDDINELINELNEVEMELMLIQEEIVTEAIEELGIEYWER